jgi:hypothetical protein
MNAFLKWNVLMVACILVMVLGVHAIAPMLPALPLPAAVIDALIWLNVRTGPDWLGTTRLGLLAYVAGVCYVLYAIFMAVWRIWRQDKGKP